MSDQPAPRLTSGARSRCQDSVPRLRFAPLAVRHDEWIVLSEVTGRRPESDLVLSGGPMCGACAVTHSNRPPAEAGGLPTE